MIYAAAPGQTAADGAGGNSPFAKSLASRLPQADLPLQLLGGSVRDDVLGATGGDQRPFVSASVTGTPIYLVPRSLREGVPGAPLRYMVDNIVITCIKRTEKFGEDEIYLRVNNGERLPEGEGSKFDIGNGESWVVDQPFSSVAPISLTVMEDDPIGDHDVIGIIETGTVKGSFTKTLLYDAGEYTVSYNVRIGT
nr:caspase family protein [Qipengyuania marisflavi]